MSSTMRKPSFHSFSESATSSSVKLHTAYHAEPVQTPYAPGCLHSMMSHSSDNMAAMPTASIVSYRVLRCASIDSVVQCSQPLALWLWPTMAALQARVQHKPNDK